MLRENVHLKNCTWLNVGGPADFLFKASSLDELIDFIKNNKKKVTVIGVGSNILVNDAGIRGTVVRLGKGFTGISCQDNYITAGAAVLDYNLANFAMANDISGLEFFIGIPGTIGGALAMNAGCYSKDTASILQSAKVVDDQGHILELNPEEIGYFYRGNKLPKDWIFIEATFCGVKSSSSKIRLEMDKITCTRKKTQPIHNKTCGSIFKNPAGYKAWQLIEKAGFKGQSLGDAQISERHCNFLINKGKATAKELHGLCEEVRKTVKLKSGVDLEWEIVFLGN